MPSKIQGLTPMILVMNDCFWLPYALESLRGRFERYVIYDAGSEDGTENVVDWFADTESINAEFFIRKLPFAVPSIQGCYRNSMLVEAENEWGFMVDADELYTTQGLDALAIRFDHTKNPEPTNPDIRYGVVRRQEIGADLTTRYSEIRGHHRLYRRNAYFRGNHPGEVPTFKQKPDNEFKLDNVTCYHFHNALRSPLEGSVPKRLDRKAQGTYHPGELEPFDLLKTLPILRKPIEAFAVSPDLERLQHVASKM